MEQSWHYLVNQFDNATDDSFRRAMKLSNYHDANLNAQKTTYIQLDPLYVRYHPIHLELVDKFTKWNSEVGYREGRTVNIRELLDETYQNLFLWDLQIQNVYNAKTSEYKGFFAEGRKIYLQGPLETRIGAYNTLQERLGSDPLLATVKQDILDAYLNLNAARNTQVSSKGIVKAKSGALKTVRLAAMTMQYRNLAICMDTFYNTPMITEGLFDIDTLRTGKQTFFTGTLNFNTKETVFTRTLLADDELLLRNTSNAEVTYYYANVKGGTNSTAIAINPNSEKKILISNFEVPEYGTYRYLTAVNNNTNIKVTYSVKIL